MHKGDTHDALHLDLDVAPNPITTQHYGPPAWVLPTLIAASVALVVCLVTVLALQHSNNETVKKSAASSAKAAALASSTAIRKTQITSCARAQVIRAFDRYRTAEAAKLADGTLTKVKRLADAYEPILDCGATYASGQNAAVPLTPSVQACFITLTAQGYWVGRDPITDPALLKPICKAAGI